MISRHMPCYVAEYIFYIYIYISCISLTEVLGYFAGIGFKSVFLITSQPHIFSNGYQIRFNEQPCQYCNVGYIVPEWVDANPTLSEINQIYGSGAALPTTILILPLKPDKVLPVKQQLSSIHPEVLLFLSKIKQLSVREDNNDPRLNTVNAIAITKETDLVQRKDIDAESFTLHLSANENGSNDECCYYMWKQKFVVRNEYRVERRMEVEEWVITLAFPNQELVQRGTNSPGVYAFLPTEMVTNFPFIIQADFLLASSRETILLDNKWNQGILNCVPIAFVNAFKSLVKDAPDWNLPNIFRFLPVSPSNYEALNFVRQSIKAKLLEEEIVPSEKLVEQKFFHKPREVGRLMPAFWSILEKARKEGVSLLSLSNHGRYILSSAFDRVVFDHILNFLEVQPVDNEWYAKCIQGSMLVEGVSEDVYLELLLFVAENWSKFESTNVKNIPLIKYEDLNGNISLFSISSAESYAYIASDSRQISWLIEWNKEFGSVTSSFFVPRTTQEAIQSCPKERTLMKWLQEQVEVGVVDVYQFAVLVRKSLGKRRKLVVSYAHFLYRSLSWKKFLSEGQVDNLCRVMPLVDSYGNVVTDRRGILVPANGSKWAELVASNLWKEESFVELAEDYMRPFHVAGKLVTPEKELLSFLSWHAKANDVPDISPPNSRVTSVSSLLTKKNAFLLLEWIRNIRSKGIPFPYKFLASIKEGSWLKVTLNGSPVSRPPPQSFLLSASHSWGNLLQKGSVLVDIPLVDQSYYGNEIRKYMEELKFVGVMSEYEEACKFIGDRLMSLAASGSLTRSNVFSILEFIRFLRTKCLSLEEFVSRIKPGKWLRTYCGDRSPSESVLLDESWRAASKISNIPFIDEGYYGEEIRDFEAELKLLGVVAGFSGNSRSYEIIVDYLKPSSGLSSLSADALLLILQCMGRNQSAKVVKALKSTKCLKTSVGFKTPSECVWFDPEWGCLLRVFNGVPLVDTGFYDKGIATYKNELKQLGVVVDFEEAVKLFVRCFKEHASNRSISKENVISFLSSYRKLRATDHKFPTELKSCIREVKWLRTRYCDFYRCPKECILDDGSQWESISPIARLPFINDSPGYYGKAIRDYAKELKSMGVVINFKDGVKFVASCLRFHDVSYITRENALSLLECIHILSQEKGYTFPEDFSKELSKAWLKTYSGYRSPKECLLFDSKWGLYLEKTDGPFIDEGFYGSKLASYREVLKAIGVIVDVENGCALIASQLCFHSESLTIVRIYNYLCRFSWEPKSEDERLIWIPNGSRKGNWVRPEICVVSDKSGLFSSQLTILDVHYEQTLHFFSNAFQVKHSPSIEDYCKLWKSWESTGQVLSHEECCKFWEYITKHFTSKTEKTLLDKLVKVPVNSPSEGIVLLNKQDVFIADDLQLKELFEQCFSRPIFVWYPQPSLPTLSRTKLLEVFQKIGVRNISESAKQVEMSISNGADQQVIPSEALIGRGLVKLILGFLASPAIKMESEARHKAVEGLLKLTVIVTVEPIDVSYSLPLSSDEALSVKASRMVRWERESSKLFTQKMDKSKGPANRIERATYFSQVIAEGVLWENGDHIHELTELLKLAFLLKFDDEAVSFLMKSKNLQVFVEDEDFLSSFFPSG